MGTEIINRETSTSKRVVLIVAILSSFLTPFLASSVNIALPSIGSHLSLDAISLNWVATSYILAAAAFLVPLGRLADIWGRKRIFQIGMILNAVASVLCGVAPSGEWLIIFRVLQGIGSSMIFGTSVAILTSVYPQQERGRALGFTVAAVYVGSSVGPLAGGFLTQYSWQSIFYLNGVIAVITTIMVFSMLKGEWAGARGEKFDLIGSILFIVAMIALVYAFSAFPKLWGFGLLALALVGFTVFVKWEMRQKFPIINVEFFRNNKVFAFSNLAALLNYSATAGVSFLLSFYLQYIKGFSSEYAGLILIVQPVMMVICSPIAGNLSDKVEPRIISSIGMALTTLGLAMLAFLGSDTNLTLVFASLFVLGVGFGLFSSPNSNAIMSSVERKYYGVASGAMGTMRLTGQALSMALILLLFSVLIGQVQISPAYYPDFLKSMQISFIIFAALCCAGVFASATRGKVHRDNNAV
jgi:EmrB/QacA subfamily drug resistance transporter